MGTRLEGTFDGKMNVSTVNTTNIVTYVRNPETGLDFGTAPFTITEIAPNDGKHFMFEYTEELSGDVNHHIEFSRVKTDLNLEARIPSFVFGAPLL